MIILFIQLLTICTGSRQHTLINAEHLKGSAFNAEVLLGVINHGLMISFITLTCTDGQQLNKQYDHKLF
jgi:hypothetical protein